MRDLIISILTLWRWRICMWFGARELRVSARAADALLRVTSSKPDQRAIVETLLSARK
jgi:hypothetical protein